MAEHRTLVAIKADDTQQEVYGDAVSDNVWGDPLTKVALPSGAGAGPDTFVVDLRKYGGTPYLVLIPTAGVNTHTAAVAWSKDGVSGTTHGSATLWSAQTGNQSEALTKKDNFAHITLSCSASEALFCYVVGRKLA